MVKITGLPVNLLDLLRKFAKDLNSLNIFYIWTGCLREEINEGLILINLLRKEYEALTSVIKKPIQLSVFLKANPRITVNLNANIIDLFEILINSDLNNQIKIEPPFNYCPYVNCNADSGRLNGKPVFPVGDSLFCGHPKLGNGLGSHLPLIGELLEKMFKGSKRDIISKGHFIHQSLMKIK